MKLLVIDIQKGITDSRLLILMNLLKILQELYKQLEIIK